tara:strand:+ start:10717 stop:11028 length:312 start_codon:yes stop_codon:yes gene_type:complete
MYAIIKTGGKQYRVAEGQTLKIEKLAVDVESTVEFDEVLMVANDGDVKVGTPMLEGAKVTATVLDQGRHKKIKIVKFKRRKHYDRQAGHRQYFTEVKIEKIAA